MLTKEKRKEYCVREAAQAVVHALGGSAVYRLAVAPTGVKEWEIEGRKGGVKKGIFSDCQTSDLMIINPYIQVDEGGNFEVQDEAFKSFVANIDENKMPNFSRNVFREIRLHLYGEVANLIASQVQSGIEVRPDEEDSSYTYANVYAHFLPRDADVEFTDAVNLIEDLLQQDEVWKKVTLLAEELDKTGDMDEVQIEGFLPQPLVNWPSSPAA